MAGDKVRDVGQSLDAESDGISTSAYVRSLRCTAGLSIAEVAERAGVNPEWLERFETGLDEVGINCDALNSLDPRWRIDDISEGVRIDGRRLEPRHVRSSSVAIGLVTKAGLVDLIVAPKGFEAGFDDLVGSSVIVDVAGTFLRVGALRDVIMSKQLLGREK